EDAHRLVLEARPEAAVAAVEMLDGGSPPLLDRSEVHELRDAARRRGEVARGEAGGGVEGRAVQRVPLDREVRVEVAAEEELAEAEEPVGLVEVVAVHA